jgi:4-amino-4-deoxy-L-arabinose transferase-like glycosyltransferase
MLIAVAAIHWVWFGLSQRSVVGDDGISLLAAAGVLEHGYPRLPSGFVYNRAYLPTYLLAGSVALFGWNDFGIIVPSVLIALGSLWLTSRIGGDVLGRPHAGLAAAAVLMVLQTQTFYATSARMYMALQGFTILAVYSAWRGFIKGERRFQLATGFAVAAAIFSHQEAGALLVALPIALLTVRVMQGDDRPAIPWPAVAAGTAALWAGFYLAALYQPANRLVVISAHGGVEPHHAGVNVNLSQWLRHALVVESMVPLGVLVAPWLGWLAARALRARRGGAHQGLVFVAATFLAAGLAIVANINNVHWRFWMMLLPLQALLVSCGAAALFEWSRDGRRGRKLLLFALWAAVILGGSAIALRPEVYAVQLRRAYGFAFCRIGSCAPEIEATHVRLREALRPGDTVVASNPLVTHYYLRRVEGFFRERRDGDTFGSFAPSATDEYLGIPMVDTQADLEALRARPGRVWVVLDRKAETYSSEAFREFVARSFELALSGTSISVYVSPSTPPASQAGRR